MTTINQGRFDHKYNLPGSLWNDFVFWSTTLETSNFEEECSAFCYFQHPDPIECSFAVFDPDSLMCYLGSFMSDDGGLGSLESSISFEGRIMSSNQKSLN